MKWSLFVDTDSLYLDTRKRFGPSARLDYLNLPYNVAHNSRGIHFFQEKLAIVMRHGREWPSFVGSLEKFGYVVVPTDRGLQPLTIAAHVMSLTQRATGIVIVTASDKIGPLVEQILTEGCQVKVSSFLPESALASSCGEKVEILTMDDSWLWIQSDRSMSGRTEDS